jgi:hypothetical protein
MNDLIGTPPGKPGRRQTHTAKAWITQPKRGEFFQSKVSLGKGRIYTRSTGTIRRNIALEYNRAHLLELLSKNKTKNLTESPQQIPLI